MLLNKLCTVLVPWPWHVLSTSLPKPLALSLCQHVGKGAEMMATGVMVLGGGKGSASPFSCCGDESVHGCKAEIVEARGGQEERGTGRLSFGKWPKRK